MMESVGCINNRAMPLAWLAIAIFLFAGASIHSHAAGLHTTHACNLCALEDLSAQGATPTTTLIPIEFIQLSSPARMVRHIVNTLSLVAILIRAPPLFF